MVRAAVVFHTGMGNTGRMAEAIARGIENVDGVEASRLPIPVESIVNGQFQNDAYLEKIGGCDAIVFGAPTYMGMVSGPFKCFADATSPLWFNHGWQDKIAAGFTTSGYGSGDKVMTLHYLATLSAQLRMVWVGPTAQSSTLSQDGRDIDKWGFYLGLGAMGKVYGDDFPDAGDILTAELYGARIAEATKRWASSLPSDGDTDGR